MTIVQLNESLDLPHPYYPPTIHLPHYAQNKASVLSLIAQFGLLWAAVLGLALVGIQRARPAASRSDRVAFAWMCLSMSCFLVP